MLLLGLGSVVLVVMLVVFWVGPGVDVEMLFGTFRSAVWEGHRLELNFEMVALEEMLEPFGDIVFVIAG